MTKPIIIGINRNEGNVHFQIRKNVETVNLLLELKDYAHLEQDWEGHRNNDGTFNKQSYLDDELQDSVVLWDNKDYRFEMFFGDKKVILIFESHPDKQQEFIDRVMNFCDWIKPK